MEPNVALETQNFEESEIEKLKRDCVIEIGYGGAGGNVFVAERCLRFRVT